jgi:hypothetical protein
MTVTKRYAIEAVGLDAQGNKTGEIYPITHTLFKFTARRESKHYQPMMPIPGRPLYELRIRKVVS